ncbi:uncharacterized protein LOC131659407 [Vicia villosa]|uniref:uncharacterized protein LOC131659407 n=1 Tax=Vicia villosa TaxID=3911 RepID=UPI00273C4435|nr:uncharacterized protein LOC131659407 [Vicia villosa]
MGCYISLVSAFVAKLAESDSLAKRPGSEWRTSKNIDNGNGDEIVYNWREQTSTPECLSTQLRTCLIKQFTYTKCGLQFAEYILRNSKVLDTMSIKSASFVNENVKHQMLMILASEEFKAFKSVGSYGLFHDGCFNNLLLRSVFFYSTRKEKGADPSLTEFYFRTHRKKDQSWVGVHVESTYDKFEQKKLEISSQNPTIPGEDEADSQPTNEMPPDLDIWAESVGKKKGNRVFGLGTASKTLVFVSKKHSSLSSDSQEVDVLRSQVHALNASLQRQEQEKMVMRQQLHRKEEKMAEANNKISFLMNHLGFIGFSSHPPQPTNESDHLNEDGVDETNEEDLSNEF